MGALEPSHESENDRNDRIFRDLPKLGSDEYVKLLRRAAASELPAQVLVRAYRQLAPGLARDATRGRLLATDAEYGYLRPLRKMAARRVSLNDWFDADYLIDEAIGEIALALAGPRGQDADRHWYSFLRQRLEDAHRQLVGRRGGRRDRPRAEPGEDSETEDLFERLYDGNTLHAPWHGRVGPDVLPWLESFVARTLATIADREIREVAQDQFGADSSPISGETRNGKVPLTQRYDATRSTIYRWLGIARVKLWAALQTQDECELDLGWLEEAMMKREKSVKRQR